ncbi:hypothetical protein [Haloarcula sp. CGMCC 1.6347]|uniref:hypothetical protein n=1 Tax=Haloarcula sp. CGMCC 1.6347 TaxID=3111455 RepID=UPI00300E954A
MKRRTYLTGTAVGLSALAGCGGGGTSGDDDSPIDAEPEELLPAADLFGDEWEKQGNGTGGSLTPIELDGDTAKNSFATDGGQQGVDVEVTVFESVDEAMSGFEDMRDADSSDPSVEDVDIASEAYLFDAFDTVYFRDANVIGMLSHVSDTSPTKPVEYGADWHRNWRE